MSNFVSLFDRAATSATEAKVAEGSGGSGGSEKKFVPSIYLVFYETAENQIKNWEKTAGGSGGSGG